MSNSGEGHGAIPYELAQKIGWPRAVSEAQRSSIHKRNAANRSRCAQLRDFLRKNSPSLRLAATRPKRAHDV
jgi:hypothetical protein